MRIFSLLSFKFNFKEENIMKYGATLLGIDVNDIKDISEDSVRHFHQILKSKHSSPCHLFYTNFEYDYNYEIPSRVYNKVIDAIVMLENLIRREDHNIEYRFRIYTRYRSDDGSYPFFSVTFESLPSSQTDPIFVFDDLYDSGVFFNIKEIKEHLIEYFENFTDKCMRYRIDGNTTNENVLSLFKNTAIDRTEEIAYYNIAEAVQKGTYRCMVLSCKGYGYFSKSLFKTLLRWGLCIVVEYGGIYADWSSLTETNGNAILLGKEQKKITIDELADYVEKLGLCVVD